jgi:hypothetical protein
MAEKELFTIYWCGVVLFGIGSFILIWITLIVEHGLLLGLTLGWVAASIGSMIIGFFWPIVVLILIGMLLIG